MSKTKCSHIIIEDTIDIDPDTSQQIFYCELCFATFDRKILPDKTIQFIEICSQKDNHK